MYAYKDVDVDRALHHFDQCRIYIPTEWFVVYIISLIQLQLVGDVHEAVRLLKYARRLRERAATPKEGKPPYIFLSSMWGYQIGHTANMEHLIKREIIRGNDTKKIILLSPDKPANQVLLDKMAAYITVARSEAEMPHPESIMRSVLEEYFVTESMDGIVKHWWHASPEIFDAWERAGRKPLLSLTDEEHAKGRAVLRQAGIPENAWFATLHVREAGFKDEQGQSIQEAGLNADCLTYLPAIKAVVERGGYVVRIGDPSMTPLPAMEGVLDYAHSPLKSPWMDIFLLGACRFFIGTSSGPAYVPPLFGIPCALTNWYPTGSRPFNRRDIYITKLFQVGKPPRLLRFEDIFRAPIGYSLHFENSNELVPDIQHTRRDTGDRYRNARQTGQQTFLFGRGSRVAEDLRSRRGNQFLYRQCTHGRRLFTPV